MCWRIFAAFVVGVFRFRWSGIYRRVMSYAWACGPPIDMKMRFSCACTLMERGRRRSVCTLDEARPFLSLIRNARFEPICVAPLLGAGGMVARDGV